MTLEEIRDNLCKEEGKNKTTDYIHGVLDMYNEAKKSMNNLSQKELEESKP